MQLYDGKIRLLGSVMNEVRKSELTAAEILLLRGIHGEDAVVDIKETGSHKRTHAFERARLATLYASPDRLNPEVLKQRQALFRDLLGHASVPLPVRLEVVEPVDEDDEAERISPEMLAEQIAGEPAFAE